MPVRLGPSARCRCHRKNKEGGRLSSIRPLSTPHLIKLLEVAILGRALESHLSCLLRRRWNPWLWIICRHLTISSGNQSNRALGIITPAVRIGIFFAGVMQSTNLVFEAGSVMLIDDRRRHEHE